MKYSDTTTTESVTSQNQHKLLIPHRSARLKKRFENTTSMEITNKFSPLTNNLTPTEHAIRNVNNSNIQDELPLIKKHHRQPKILMTLSYSTYQKKTTSAIWKISFGKGLEFLP